VSETQYEQETARLKRMQWDADFPCGLRNCFHAAGITSKKQLIDYRKAGGSFTRFTGIGEKYESMILEWLDI